MLRRPQVSPTPEVISSGIKKPSDQRPGTFTQRLLFPTVIQKDPHFLFPSRYKIPAVRPPLPGTLSPPSTTPYGTVDFDSELLHTALAVDITVQRLPLHPCLSCHTLISSSAPSRTSSSQSTSGSGTRVTVAERYLGYISTYPLQNLERIPLAR